MLLRETDLLTFYKNQWILDLRFSDKSILRGVELMLYKLVENSGFSFACTLRTDSIGKETYMEKDMKRRHRILKDPLYKINGLLYASHGSGSGHIGYFMDEFPDYSITDPHPYDKHEPFMDDVDSLYLSQAFTIKPVYSNSSYYRGDHTYHWKGVAYWMGETDTDIDLHVFERRSQVPEPLKLIQSRLF